MIVKCQLYIDNDLFKVVEFQDLKMEIYFPLPEAYTNLTSNGLVLEELATCTLCKLLFILEGIVEKKDDVVIARYRYAGGSK